jgi:UrcA family protein
MTRSNVRFSLTSLAALAALAGATASSATSPSDQYVTHSVKVSFADLNLGSQAGAMALYERIQRAARKVCTPDTTERGLQRYRDWKACYDTAVTNAVGKVNSPLLSALHSSKAPDQRLASNVRTASQK